MMPNSKQRRASGLRVRAQDVDEGHGPQACKRTIFPGYQYLD